MKVKQLKENLCVSALAQDSILQGEGSLSNTGALKLIQENSQAGLLKIVMLSRTK